MMLILSLSTVDVGVMHTDKNQKDVSRFLNRLLGMNLNRQHFMTSYFLKSLENEVNTAKRAGSYDVGIKTLNGNNIEFPDVPRTFCFRGLAAPDDRVLLYKVAQDQGTSPETAMELYNDAKGDNVPTSRRSWNSRGSRLEVRSGFYVDRRHIYRVTPKVFLIINSGEHAVQSEFVYHSFYSHYDLHSPLHRSTLRLMHYDSPQFGKAHGREI